MWILNILFTTCIMMHHPAHLLLETLLSVWATIKTTKKMVDLTQAGW